MFTDCTKRKGKMYDLLPVTIGNIFFNGHRNGILDLEPLEVFTDPEHYT
jgi:hypothetical protein